MPIRVAPPNIRVETDEEADGPSRRLRQPRDDEEGDPEHIHQARDQEPRPASRQFAAMLQRVHDGGDAFGDEIGAGDDGQRAARPASGAPAAYHAGQHGERGRDQRPPEARRAARPERHDQPADSGDQEHPAEEDGDAARLADCGHDQRCEAEDHEQDAFRTGRLSSAP